MESYACFENVEEDLINQFRKVISKPLGMTIKIKCEPKTSIKTHVENMRKYAAMANIKKRFSLFIKK